MTNRHALAALFLFPIAAAAWADVAVNSGAALYKCSAPGGGVAYQAKPCDKPHPSSEKLARALQASSSIDTDYRNGRQEIEGSLNGVRARFIVDTGAQVTAIPSSLAQSAGLECPVSDAQKFKFETAGGRADGCVATAARLSVGPFKFEAVKVAVMPALQEPLLGMNVLESLKIKKIQNGPMTLSYESAVGDGRLPSKALRENVIQSPATPAPSPSKDRPGSAPALGDASASGSAATGASSAGSAAGTPEGASGAASNPSPRPSGAAAGSASPVASSSSPSSSRGPSGGESIPVGPAHRPVATETNAR